ncbi:MAG: sulfatase-like hydrolase/transferase [Alphaproteobacteria bacterium]|nr:sulfatase-like hydrolase/transferase [Alphaproteobacteria bacterium]
MDDTKSPLTRRRLLAGAGALAATGAVAWGLRQRSGDLVAPAVAGDLNVLYISADELNPNFLGHVGHPDARTPRLDALAAQGMRLSKVYATAPTCAPTRQSMLTGLHPLEHGVFLNGYVFDARTPTLASYFGAQGLRTACIGKLHTDNDEANQTFGFDTVLSPQAGPRWRAVEDGWQEGVIPSSPDIEDAIAFATMPFNFGGTPQISERENTDWILVEEALRWLEDHREERFFLYVSMRAPHYPFAMPEDFYYLFDPADVTLPVVRAEDREGSQAARQTWKKYRWGDMTEAHTRLVLARYLGATAWLDHLVGRLLDALDRLGLAQKTLVVFTSDHGDMCGEKGLWLKSQMFDPACRKPTLMRLPGVIEAGSRYDGLVSEVDLWPTVAGLVGVGGGLDALPISGRDQSAALLGEPADPRTCAFATLGAPDERRWPWLHMARDERYKLCRYRNARRKPELTELYDLERDPHEVDNIAGLPELAEVRARLEQAADDFLGGLRAPAYPPVKGKGISED